jgi:hypothetical protein
MRCSPRVWLGVALAATRQRALSFRAVRVVLRILPAEFFSASCGINQLLPARPPWVTRGADGDAELRDR